MTAPLRPHLDELLPVVRRAAALDPDALIRLRVTGSTITVLAALPFRVLVSRAVTVPAAVDPLDITVGAASLVSWADDPAAPEPARRDGEWRGALPPVSGWQRLDRIPDAVVRDLVRSGALALKDAAAREGLPGAQPRAEVADALLDAVVLTVTGDAASRSAGVTLRTVSALVRMGFVPRGSEVTVDVAGRWTRVSGTYGAAYAEAPGLMLLR